MNPGWKVVFWGIATIISAILAIVALFSDNAAALLFSTVAVGCFILGDAELQRLER